MAGTMHRVYLAGPDSDGMAVEPFGLMENLMVVESLCDRVVHPTFEAAVAAAAGVLAAARQGE